MPIFMDVHNVPGVKAKDVAEAHRKDLLLQEHHGCNCMTYWIDEQRETIFCLIEAPVRESVEEMHRQAHGLVPHKIIEVSSSVVESFLGRIYDPEEARVSDDGLKVFADPSFRILVVTQITDPVLLQNKLGKDKAHELLSSHSLGVRKAIAQFGGREVEQEGSGFIISFTSATKAVSCALAIVDQMHEPGMNALALRIAISAGEPVANSNRLFGDTIQSAANLCFIAKELQIAVTSQVKELLFKDHFLNGSKSFLSLSPQDEGVVELLFHKLAENWQDAEFDMDNYCRAVTMSKSQLYRKTISLTGLSPNILLKEYRLARARELMKQQRYSIAQITFDCGFTSASYFTKCFKKKYGLLPMAYIDLLH